MKTLFSLGKRQQQLLRSLLHNSEGLTKDQLAEMLGISRNAVAQHINIVQGLKYVDSVALPSGGGRPSQAYRLTDLGRALFPKQYALFSKMFLRLVGEGMSERALEKFLSRIGEELAGPFKERVEGSPNRLEEVRLIMEELGYETLRSPPDSDHEIVAKNCVFHELAIENQAVCSLDRSLIGSLLGKDIEQTACMAKGDNSCRFCESRETGS